jgi:hypothetical protein
VPIPGDEDGFLGRECPRQECLGYFKVKPGTGLTGPGLKCHCPYCGHTGDPNTFWTPDQIEYAKSVAVRQIADEFHRELKRLQFKHLKVSRGNPTPIRHYREKRLETTVTCDQCTLAYSVYGLFAYCPDCRVHNSLQVLQLNLALVAKQLDLARAVDPDLARHLIEDALENCVSAFDGFGRESCRVRAHRSAKPDRAEKMSFQNLDRAAVGLSELFGIDLPAAFNARDWQSLQRGFLKRHVIAHRSAVIDEKYQVESGDTTIPVGRRIVVDRTEVEEISRHVARLAETLLRLLPSS